MKNTEEMTTKMVRVGTADYPLTIYGFNVSKDYLPPPGNTYPKDTDEEGCGHPECDALDHEDDGACPWKSGTCFYCAYSDCQKFHPKCDGLTYDERNKTT